MKTRTIRSGILSLLAASLAFVVVSGFKPLPVKTGPVPAFCSIGFSFVTTNTYAYSSIEDSFSDQWQANSNGWSGTFTYQGGSLIFTAQIKQRHSGGTLTLKNVTTNTIVDTETVPANSNAVFLLIEPGTPTCGDQYEVKFQ